MGKPSIGDTLTRATLAELATLANSKPIEGRPYKFWGRLHAFYCSIADTPAVLADIPTNVNFNPGDPTTNSRWSTQWSVDVGDIAMNYQTRECFELMAYPQSEFTNWRKLPETEFTMNAQPAGTPGRAWFQEFESPYQMGFADFWFRLWNRMRHNLMRKCGNQDGVLLTNPSWLNENVTPESGPWVLESHNSAGVNTLIEGGWGPTTIANQGHASALNWGGGHQVGDVQVYYSDEVEPEVTYRIEPEWFWIRQDSPSGVVSGRSGFRMSSAKSGRFRASTYTTFNINDPVIHSQLLSQHRRQRHDPSPAHRWRPA
jgi:hypothetical protein